MKTVLLVEDEEYAMQDLNDILCGIDPFLEIHTAKNASEAIAAIAANSYNAVFLDIELPGMSGIEMLKSLQPPLPPVILVTAHVMHAMDAFGLGAVECLLKPLDEDNLRAVYQKIVKDHEEGLAEIPPTEPGSVFLGRNDHVLLREETTVHLVKVGCISRLQSSGETIHVFFPHGTGSIEKSLDEIETRIDPKIFFRANPTEIIKLLRVDRLKLTNNGNLVAQFLDGLEVCFDADRSRIFEQMHRL